MYGTKSLAKVTVKYLQTAYINFTCLLQLKWKYLPHTVPDAKAHCGPVDETVQYVIILALRGCGHNEVYVVFRPLLSHNYKQGGLTI